MTAVRRWRRCPACHDVNAAGEFLTTGRHRPGYGGKQRGRRCPSCGYTGATWVFKVVREKRGTATTPARPIPRPAQPLGRITQGW